MPDYTVTESDANLESDKDISSGDNSMQYDPYIDSESDKDISSGDNSMQYDPYIDSESDKGISSCDNSMQYDAYLDSESDKDISSCDNSMQYDPYLDSESDKDISSGDNPIQSDLDPDSESEKDTSSLACDSTVAMSVDPHLMYKDEKLPFPHLPRSWYIKEQRFYNATRDTLRKTKPVERDSTNTIICMNRSQVQGTLENNLENLHKTLSDQACSNAKACHYKAISEVGTFILLNGPLVKTQEAGTVYLKCKGLDKRKRSCEYYEIFSKHLNLIQVYIFDTGYLLPDAWGRVETFIHTIKSIANTNDILNKTINNRLKCIFQSSLEYIYGYS